MYMNSQRIVKCLNCSTHSQFSFEKLSQTVQPCLCDTDFCGGYIVYSIQCTAGQIDILLFFRLFCMLFIEHSFKISSLLFILQFLVLFLLLLLLLLQFLFLLLLLIFFIFVVAVFLKVFCHCILYCYCLCCYYYCCCCCCCYIRQCVIF